MVPLDSPVTSSNVCLLEKQNSNRHGFQDESKTQLWDDKSTSDEFKPATFLLERHEVDQLTTAN